MSDPFTERLLNLGRQYDAMMSDASIERCNCMVRYGESDQMPAIRRGKNFTDPEGRPLAGIPTSYEDMHHMRIKALLKLRGEVYIGHMVEP